MEKNSIVNFYLDFAKRHPAFRTRDIYKIIYQSYFGPAHVFGDFEGAREFFNKEFDEVEEKDGNVFELINPDRCIYWLKFACAKKKGVGKRNVWDVFLLSTNSFKSDLVEFKRVWNLTSVELRKIENFDLMELSRLDRCVEAGNPPLIHHSKSFADAERPRYRIVLKKAVESVGGRILEVFLEENL
jgi:hypothetical protein